MQASSRRWNREKGAMIIQAAVASIAFLALAALAVDWGVKLIARGEAQRAADAGALAGAISLAFDASPGTSVDLTEAGLAKRNAHGFAVVNTVFGQAPVVDIKDDVTFPECPAPDGGPGTTCVQVDVYRNDEGGNPLPTFFSRIVGVRNQGVKATATAKVLTGTQTECLRPWVVIDRWDEFGPIQFPAADPEWCPGGACGAPSTYDKYSDGKGQAPPQENDSYVPPATDGSSPGTGFRVLGTPNDIGRQFALKVQTNDGITPGWGLAVDLPRADTNNLGASAYGDNILSCNRKTVSINDPVANPCPTDANQLNSWAQQVAWAEKGCLRVQTGTMQGPTSSNVGDLVARDSGAQWGWNPQTSAYGVINSAFPESPRIVPVAILDIDKYLAQNPTGSGGVISVVNMFGFFIEGMGDYNDKDGSIEIKNGGKAVIGRLVKISASGRGTTKLHDASAFSKIIVLVR